MATLGCIKAKMGDTPYYIAKMLVGELIRSVGIAKELPEWEDMTADEKMQRECDLKRIIDEIVPYIVNEPDHFFGSLIVDIFSGFSDITFEPISSVITDIPKAYSVALQDFGALTLPGRERLIALDGQHRLLALRIAVMGESGVPAGYKGNISNLKPHPELAAEEISVILVEHTDTKKIRRIFNKINKYAKQTSRSDNIITSDDDIFAVIARRLISKGELLEPQGSVEIVNWKNTSLSERSKNLTTISTLYSVAETLLKSEFLVKDTRLSQDEELQAYGRVLDFWKISLEHIDVFKEYLRLTKLNQPVSPLRESNLLMKPVTQMALAYVARFAFEHNQDWTQICQKINSINWSFDNDLWFNILVIARTNKKMITGKESVRHAGLIISYIVMGNLMTKEERAEVKKIICNAKNDDNAQLPQMI